MNEYPEPSESSSGSGASHPAEGSQQGTPPPRQVQLSVRESAPYVVYSIIGVTGVVYLLQLISEWVFNIDLPLAYRARINEAIQAGELWRFLTPALLHGSPMHIAFNMYALFAFGATLERHFGHWRFLILYVLGAFTGNVLSFLLTDGYSVGASTAVFGLVGAEGVFLYQNRKMFAGRFSSAIQNVIFVVAINLFLGFSSSGIDNAGHIGGLFGGLIFTWFAGPLWEIEGIAPMLHLVDQRSGRDVIIGAGTVLFIFGALAMWGMVR